MSLSLNELINVFKSKYYHDVRSFLEKSKTGEPNDQFKNNYEARKLLDEMTSLLEARIDNGENDCSRETSMLAAVYYLRGCVSMDVDESSEGEKNLNKSLELINNDPLHVNNVLTYISCYNQLGLLWCDRGDYASAINYLKKSEEHYKHFNSSEEPIDFEKLLTDVDGKESGKVGLERIHTLSLYYLAQALGASGDAINAAAYCHKTLKRQLNSPALDKADWALNAATLSQVLVERNAFKEAKNHLVAASRILELLQADLDKAEDPDSERHQAEMLILSERKAEVCRCWAKYCLNLLSMSKDRLLDDEYQLSQPPVELKGLEFENIDLQGEESKVSYTFALTWDDASALYKHGCAWLEGAKKHYTLEDHATDYVSIVRDHSQLYLALAFFSDDISNQYKMHKRRLDMLKEISDQLNPTYYIDLLRQLWFEQGETYITMIDLKSDRIFSERNDYLPKINALSKQGINIFQKFLDSFSEHKNSERYEEGYERSVLLSKIHVAKLLLKIKSEDKMSLIQYNTIAYNYYKEVVAYSEKWTSAEALSEGEVRLCKEMSNLLPLILNKLRSRD